MTTSPSASPSPPLRWADDSGYLITAGDLALVRLDWSDLAAAQRRDVPLGMDSAEYAHFRQRCAAALSQCGATDAHVHLQGSAAYLFSGRHKHFPCNRADVVRLMRERGDSKLVVTDFPLRRAERMIASQWPNTRPLRPFFDSLYVLGIDMHRSDVDVQVSSDALVQAATQHAALFGPPDVFDVTSRTYSFVKTDVAEAVAAPLFFFADEMTAILRRTVTVKIFPSAGPPVPADPTEISSAFCDQDWRVDFGGDLV